jgi:hypothetical protein
VGLERSEREEIEEEEIEEEEKEEEGVPFVFPLTI